MPPSKICSTQSDTQKTLGVMLADVDGVGAEP